MQVKCTYSSNDTVFTPGLIYDVRVVYIGACLNIIVLSAGKMLKKSINI